MSVRNSKSHSTFTYLFSVAGSGDVVVVVELQQTPEDDFISARDTRGRRTSLSQLMHMCR